MRILFLGGTRFLGRYAVEAALARGHAVTIFTRGKANPWGSAVTSLLGDRDPAKPPGLDPLRNGDWDAVIDTSGYVPRVVRASAELLKGRTQRYLFVSSISVYTDGGGAGRDESAATQTLDDPATEEIMKHYGPLKAACEEEVRAAFGDAAIIVRPGLIVGPHDPSDRFGYWVARFRNPALLGDRAAFAIVPEPRNGPVQFIDVRDLGAFLVELVETKASGTFNACSPAGHWTWQSLVDALRSEANAPAAKWIDEALLTEHKVEPWSELPLWLPSSFIEEAGFMEFDCRRAEGAGLRVRPLAETIDASATWLAERPNADAWKAVLTAEREREILAAVAAGAPSVR